MGVDRVFQKRIVIVVTSECSTVTMGRQLSMDDGFNLLKGNNCHARML